MADTDRANRPQSSPAATRSSEGERHVGPDEWGRFLQSAFNALSAHIAILDEAGTVVAVNRAWRHFAQNNGYADAAAGVGANYLAVCERASGDFSAEAPIAASGIRDVTARQRDQFYLEYPCHSPDVQRWFALRATPLESDGQRYVVVAHENITERVLRDTLERQYTERLSVLHDIDRAILAAQSPETIAAGALSHLQKLVGCRWASVVLFDFAARETQILAHTVEARVREGGPRYSLDLSPDLDVIVERLRSGEAYLLDLTTLREPPPVAQTLLATGLRYHLCVPLIVQGRLFGSLLLGTDRPDSIASEHVSIVREVATPLAVAIQQAHLSAQLRAGHERQQALARQLLEVQERERRHIARELHDEIGQILTGLKLAVDMSMRVAADQLPARLGEVQALAGDLMARVRDLSLDLRPMMLDDLGLLPALLWLFERDATQFGLRVSFEHAGIDRRFRPEVETAVYRIVQEALTNVARHAGVRAATVRLWAASGTLHLEVEDAGRGFDVPSVLGAGASGGLSGMQERALLLGSRLIIQSAPGTGTRLAAKIAPIGADGR